MNLLNNLAPVGEGVKKKNEFGMNNPLQFFDMIQDLMSTFEEEDNKEQLCNIITDIKNHIDKFGVSEELLSLIPNDLSALNIDEHTSKEDSINVLNDILSEHGEISEEGIRDLFRKIFPKMFKKIVGLGNRIDIKLDDLNDVIVESKKVSALNMKNIFEKPLRISLRDYKTVSSTLADIKTALALISTMDESKILEFKIDEHKSVLEKLGYTKDGTVYKAKIKSYPRMAPLKDFGYNEKNSLALAQQFSVLTPIINKIDNIGKFTVSTNEEKSKAKEIKQSVKEFSNYVGCVYDVTYRMINTMINLLVYIYNL